ncbi:hypothetical protein [Shumkonia mesophila]|uniref:hypothetical protein n=1 Tax=Shumkonia mesophila TaxID=2838854 RepID=UPI0029341F18|nr:hypothetical protein [Shumkonia mesophila]
MKPFTGAWFAFLIALVVTALSFEASAQMSNKPFSFKYRGGAGESVGMSTAHKQLILERELQGRAPDNPVIRDFSGALLEVERRNSGQAFVRSPASPYLPGAVSDGFRSGLSAADEQVAFSGFSIGTGRVMASWMLALSGGDGYRGVTPLAGPASSASIDLWIGQLQAL